MDKKFIPSKIKDIDEKSGIISAIASTEDSDRVGDVIKNDSWDLKNYKKNPLLLWQHNADLPPIGKITSITNKSGKLEFKAELAHEINPFAKMLWNMIKDKFLNAFSVGYIPKDFDEKGNTTSAELLEVSLVNVPANPNAVVTAEYKAFEKAVKEYEDTKKEQKENMSIDYDKIEKIVGKIDTVEKIERVESQVKEIKATLNTMVGVSKRAEKKSNKRVLKALRIVDKAVEDLIVINKKGKK